MPHSHKDELIRIVDLERLRARRRTLKGLLVGAGVIGSASAIHAQQSAAKKVIPPINLLLSDDSPVCDTPENSSADAPTTPATPSSTEFLLNETNYTGTASRQFVVNTEGSECGHIVTITYSVCLEVQSSTMSEASVDMDVIAIIEGLSAVDPNADEPAVEYYIRRDGSVAPDITSGRSIKLNETNNFTAVTGQVSRSSCGFVPVRLNYSLRIENNRPIMTIQSQSRDTPATSGRNIGQGFSVPDAQNLTVPAVQHTIPSMQINFAPGDCAHPTRSNSLCIFTGSQDRNGDDDVGIIILTTPDPSATGGPVG